MKIRNKLFIYYGVLLVVCYGIAALLTGIVISAGLDRLLFSNIYDLNQNIVEKLDVVDDEDFASTLDSARQFTEVELMVYQDGNIFYSSFVEEEINFENSFLVNSTYQVYRARTDVQTYYYTSSVLNDGNYEVFVFRGEGFLMEENQELYLLSFIGVVFLVVSITLISIFSARSFANPLRILTEYASDFSVETKPQQKPFFKIAELEELALSIERAQLRVYEYNQSEQEFLHNFSHEMKTPLTNIYSYAEAILYGVLTEEENENACNIIMRESEKLKDFINQILYLGRLDTVGDNLNRSKINLVDVIGDSLNSVDIQAKEKGIELKFDTSEENIYFMGDPEKLEVAFVNILTNAIRYATSQVCIKLTKTKTELLIEFDDDGAGIDEDIKEKIWERYVIGKEGHTGLGLTITKSIIEKHGGKIQALKNEWNGAKIQIRISNVEH
ncbi:MAG: HAMP domain-containing histidine kinase [Firmicutes bacterium]|nr:HAMP domain-containing histidine kinase [Bacillota bacterium]